MIVDRQLKQSVLIYSCMASIVPQYAHISLISSLIISSLFVWRWLINIGRAPSPSSVVIQCVAAIAFFVSFVFGGASQAGITLDDILTALCVALTLKLFETSRSRDFGIIYVFNLLLIGVDLCYGRGTLTWVLCAVAFVLLLLAMSMHQTKAKSRTVGHAIRLTFSTIVLAFPLALVFVGAVPPDGMAKWSFLDLKKSGKTGMSDSMAPGDVSSLTLSDELAFSGRFTSAVPLNSNMYWRAAVLDTFDGAKWSASHRLPRAGQNFGDLMSSGKSVSYKIDLEPSSGLWIPSLDAVTRILPSNGTAGVTVDQSTREIRSTRLSESASHFAVVSSLEYIVDKDSLPQKRRYLQLPTNNQRSALFARRLREEVGTDKEFVGAVLQKFNREAFSYSLNPSPAGKLDPVDTFMFETRQGFCEHYASAFAFLARSAGIPSRVVVGYQGTTEIDYSTGRFSVNQSEAHAWAEYWLEGSGWIRVDPTGFIDPSRVQPKPEKSAFRLVIARLMRATGSASGFFKIGSIQSPDYSNQEGQAGHSSADATTSDGAKTNFVRDRLVVTTSGIALCFLGLVGLMYCRRRQKVMSRDLPGFLLRHFLIVMRGFGFRRNSSETLQEFVTRSTSESPELTRRLQRQIAEEIQSMIYGRDLTQSAPAHRSLSELKRMLPLQRRLLAEVKIASDIYL